MPSSRRLILLVLLGPLLNACLSRGIPQPQGVSEQQEARSVLKRSAEAHGLANWLQLQDISVSYAGEWSWLVSRLQPVLTDADFRQGSEERLIMRGEFPRVAQQHVGPQGQKQVFRSRDAVEVLYNGTAGTDTSVVAAAALVADGYRMFLTGPFYFLDGTSVLEMAGSEILDGQVCDLIVAVRRPGLGLAAADSYLLWIDRHSGLLRRIRFSLNGLDSTQGAIAEVDLLDYREVDGILWPTRFFERLRKPIPNLPVHEWRVTGLDINRGLVDHEIRSQSFTGKAAAPARRLPPP